MTPDWTLGPTVAEHLNSIMSSLMYSSDCAVQVNVSVVQPDVDAGLSLSNALKQSVSSGRLGTAISSVVGYDVSVSSETENRMYILAQAALTQAQIAAGITSECCCIGTCHPCLPSLPPCHLAPPLLCAKATSVLWLFGHTNV